MSRELCEHYGPHLYDYCRTELGEPDAELAAAGTLLTASARAGQVTDPAALRPWLYALARAHRAARAASHPASTGSWARSSRMSDLLPEALIALDGPYRELLDLSVRHGLPHAEIALLFDVPESLIDATVREAAWRLETWLAAVTAARAAHGCAQLAGRVAEWAAAPSRSTRARLGRHLYGCVSCLAAPKGLPAATLLTHLPIAAPRGPLSDLLPLASPLAPDAVGWRADGFPVQSHGLGGVPHARLADGAALATTPPSALTATHAAYADARAADPLNTPVADPTTATGAGVRPGAGAAAPGRIPLPSGPDFTSTDAFPRLSPDPPPTLEPTSASSGPGAIGASSGPVSTQAPSSVSSGLGGTSALSGPSPAGGASSGGGSGASPEGVPADHTFSGRASGDTPGEAAGSGYLDALIAFGADRRTAAPDAEATDASLGPMAGPPLGFGGPARPGGSSHAGQPGRGHPYATPIYAAPVYGAEPDEPPTTHEPALRSIDFQETDPRGAVTSGRSVTSRGEATPFHEDAALPRADTGPSRAGATSSRGDAVPHGDMSPARGDTRPSHGDGGDFAERDPYTLSATPEEPLAEDEFRAWERRGGKWDEFWKDRPDEADPEARISVRSVARVGLLVGAGVLVAGLAWSGIHARPRPTTISEAAAPQPRPVVTLNEPGSDPEVEVPPQENPGTTNPEQLIPGRTPPPTTSPTTNPAEPRDGTTKKPSDTRSSDDSPDPPREPTTAPTRQPTRQPTKQPAKQPTKQPTKAPDRGPAKESAEPMAKKVELPKPPPPSARLSNASASLGSGRMGSFSLDCEGSCQITSASGSNGISVSGSSYTVSAPTSRPGCPGAPTTESGTITVSWSGTRSGDGTTTAGTTSGDGTLTMSVSWTVAKDKGTFVPDMKGGGYWSNCSPNSADY
ncbi:PT domain-containing protein [Nonomuraea sp. NPDC050547]|uniref:PT domain-containing protein n=1 Tax=Nonomuraea sp. NPDC050547 TaxID=3364368 RepID=UPI0037BD8FD8